MSSNNGSASASSDDGDTDFYAVLNVPREATEAEIKQAYYRLCTTYHPDKHHADQHLQQVATEIFPKIQRAFAVLSDPQQRTLYDIYGASGLEAGKEITAYCNTAGELLAEYEIRQRRIEQERVMAMANADGKMSVKLDASSLLSSPWFGGDDEFIDLGSPVEVMSMSLDQSVESQLTDDDVLKLNGRLVAQQGRGGGSLAATVKHTHSATRFSEWTVGFGSTQYIAAKLQQAFWQSSFIAAELLLQQVDQHNGDIGIIPGFSCAVYQPLGSATHGMMRLTAGLDNSLSSHIAREFEGTRWAGSVQVGVSKSFVGVEYSKKVTEHTKVKLGCRLGLLGASFSYGAERHIEPQSRLAVSIKASTVEGVTLCVKYTRVRQVYDFPIFLCPEITPESMVYGTLVPAALFFVFRQLVIVPWAKRDELKRLKEARRRNRPHIRQQRREANAAIQLMQQTYSRSVAAETRVEGGGLVIEKALFGQLVSTSTVATSDEDTLVIDVTMPLQCLVHKSALILHAGAKSHLVGFYDPCPDEPKRLWCRYRFQGRLHETTIDDEAELKIPKRKDCLPGY
eukprot:m.153012 g.153012  ORF g.153012 m.153012 type:complete len:568 (-) comp17455_c0_seq3:96-1799(-)